MSFINKFGKTTIASSIVAASVLGASNVSHASGSGAGPGENAQGQRQDDAAFGNTKNLRMLFSWLAMPIFQYSISLL